MANTMETEVVSVQIDPPTADAKVVLRLGAAIDGTMRFASTHEVLVPATMPLNQIATAVSAALTAEGFPMLAALDATSLGAILTAARANKGKAHLPQNIRS